MVKKQYYITTNHANILKRGENMAIKIRYTPKQNPANSSAKQRPIRIRGLLAGPRRKQEPKTNTPLAGFENLDFGSLLGPILGPALGSFLGPKFAPFIDWFKRFKVDFRTSLKATFKANPKADPKDDSKANPKASQKVSTEPESPSSLTSR